MVIVLESGLFSIFFFADNLFLSVARKIRILVLLLFCFFIIYLFILPVVPWHEGTTPAVVPEPGCIISIGMGSDLDV